MREKGQRLGKEIFRESQDDYLSGLTFRFLFYFILFLLLFIYSNVFMILNVSGSHEFSFHSDYCICVIIMICNNDGNRLGN